MGQPHPQEPEGAARRPSAAERVRTLVESSASASLGIPGHEPGEGAGTPGQGTPASRAVVPSGDIHLLLPASSPVARATVRAAGEEVPAVLELTDVAPVAVPHRIRGRARVSGWLTALPGAGAEAAGAGLPADPAGPLAGPGWALLRLEVGEAYTDDLWGAEHVEPDEFAEAAADPLARHETELLQHLAAAHEEQLQSLCSLLPEICGMLPSARPPRVAPLSLDRFGLRVRLCHGGSCIDARFEFPEPVQDVTRLRRAMRHLFEAAAG
ncbi:DUF2470 domain-containing protein [Streptomyces hoynatensis]|uniref:DUF2470 domain-containing protein n=1 Tax=Streptomyces hoynatensis TaxID=1141874 RepID=A0A3A9ZBD0_9ACTN|nr:DUF2470 domain-containing protein [Streptomyces hoynatensis]